MKRVTDVAIAQDGGSPRDHRAAARHPAVELNRLAGNRAATALIQRGKDEKRAKFAKSKDDRRGAQAFLDDVEEEKRAREEEQRRVQEEWFQWAAAPAPEKKKRKAFKEKAKDKGNGKEKGDVTTFTQGVTNKQRGAALGDEWKLEAWWLRPRRQAFYDATHRLKAITTDYDEPGLFVALIGRLDALGRAVFEADGATSGHFDLLMELVELAAKLHQLPMAEGGDWKSAGLEMQGEMDYLGQLAGFYKFKPSTTLDQKFFAGLSWTTSLGIGPISSIAAQEADAKRSIAAYLSELEKGEASTEYWSMRPELDRCLGGLKALTGLGPLVSDVERQLERIFEARQVSEVAPKDFGTYRKMVQKYLDENYTRNFLRPGAVKQAAEAKQTAQQTGRQAANLAKLTPIEAKVAELRAQNKSAVDISDALKMSVDDVKTHVASIQDKIEMGRTATDYKETFGF
jgi:DNA-binding CsgD family transcriptional regulator